MINANDVVILTPAIDRRLDSAYIDSVDLCKDFWNSRYRAIGFSDLPLCRNVMVNWFLKSRFEWAQLIDSDISFTREDWEILWERDDDLLVTAPYARKEWGEPAAEFGLGFTRVHRSVFERINDALTDDGTEIAQRFYHKGEVLTHFFPVGVSGESRWLGEDRAFFVLARLAGVRIKITRRCKLVHWGATGFHYPKQLPDCVVTNLLAHSMVKDESPPEEYSDANVT